MANQARRVGHDRVLGRRLKRRNASQRGYDRRWRRVRREWLANHPYCAQCDRDGFVRAATVVDHIKPHRGNETLFWDPRNRQSLCKRCHDRKTASGQ